MTENLSNTLVGFAVVLLFMFFIGYFGWNVSGRKDSIKNAFLGSGGIIVWIVLVAVVADAVGNDYLYLLIFLSPVIVIGTIKLFGGKKDKRPAESASAGEDVYVQIEQMALLKEKGVLSELEFDEQKRKLLNM